MINKNIFQFPISYTGLIGQIAIGWGVHETVADECKAHGIKKALITTTGLKGTGIVDEIKSILNYHGIPTEIFNKITSNPKDYEMMEAYKVFKETGCDGVVSVGGGSSHDVGKGLRAVAANGGRYCCEMSALIDPPWMEEIKKYQPATIPQIAVNTTAGTGAESTNGAAVVNTRVKAKQLIMIAGLGPTIALTDPLLVRCLPKHLAAQTGFDAYAHAFESCISRMPSHYGKAIAYYVVKLVSENLREFAYNRMNHKACEAMCWAESMATVGLVFGGGVGIVHALGHGISVFCGTHHGLASAVLAVPGERYNQPSCVEKMAEMAAAVGVNTGGMTRLQAADKWLEELERLLKDLNIRTGDLNKQFGLKKEDIPHIVQWQYKTDFAREGNPRDFDYDEAVKLMESLL